MQKAWEDKELQEKKQPCNGLYISLLKGYITFQEVIQK